MYFIIYWGTCEGTCMFSYLDARRNEPIHACSIVGPDTCCRCIFTVNVLTSLWLASSICGLHCCSVIYIHEPRRESGRDGVGAASVMPSWSSACTHVTHEGGAYFQCMRCLLMQPSSCNERCQGARCLVFKMAAQSAHRPPGLSSMLQGQICQI